MCSLLDEKDGTFIRTKAIIASALVGQDITGAVSLTGTLEDHWKKVFPYAAAPYFLTSMRVVKSKKAKVKDGVKTDSIIIGPIVKDLASSLRKWYESIVKYDALPSIVTITLANPANISVLAWHGRTTEQYPVPLTLPIRETLLNHATQCHLAGCVVYSPKEEHFISLVLGERGWRKLDNMVGKVEESINPMDLCAKDAVLYQVWYIRGNEVVKMAW